MSLFTTLRRILDGLYKAGGVIAALFLIAILALIVIQMVARWTGEVFLRRSLTTPAIAWPRASFFAFAYAH